MRDAFGGIFMIRLLLVFIVIYVAFAAISLNYAKAFRIKNQIIDFVETNEITDLNQYFSKANGKNLSGLNKILDNANYNKECKNGNGIIKTEEGIQDGYCYRGIVIKEIKPQDKAMKDKYIIYEINTYADWNLGSLNMILALGGQSKNSKNIVNGAWEITGEAKIVKRKEKEIR